MNDLNIAFLSTYPPRKCGIATFTHDLFRELQKNPHIHPHVIAISDDKYVYNDDVIFDLPQQNRESYINAAKKVNESTLQLIVIEHEYGIFGGSNGEYLLDFINALQKPIITTLHTVLPHPNEKQKNILELLCKKSEKIIIMAENSRLLLQNVYHANPEKIEKIHHGVPYFDVPNRTALKKQLKLENRTIISTFGLLSPSKGLDYGIKAVYKTVQKYPNVLYFILGQTHPVISRKYGETYRESLQKLVSELHLENNVTFINKYLSKEDIVRWLKLSDIYMTPYLGKGQAVSGTLAYAAGYGRVIISTPYPYAKEMLADGRGLLAGFQDSDALSDCINYLIEHPQNKNLMENKMLFFGKNMLWHYVADHYANLFNTVCHDFKIAALAYDNNLAFTFDSYLLHMTDDTGIFQHSLYALPDPSEGYTSDDNARALIMVGLLYSDTKEQKYLNLIIIYLRFLLYAQKDGWFGNFMDYDRHFKEIHGSEDCFGRCVWALGTIVSLTNLPSSVRTAADKMLNRTIKNYPALTFLRAKAYSLLGLAHWHNTDKTRSIIDNLSHDLYTAYNNNTDKNWRWFENNMTYCNAVLPNAMLTAFTINKNEHYKAAGLDSLDFLLTKTIINDTFSPIGCKGWLQKDRPAARFDQQPVEACATLLACLKAYRITHKDIYNHYAQICFAWYTGKNISNLSLIDAECGGCYDGITADGLNKNEGAESLIAWIIANIMMQRTSKPNS